MAENKFIMKLKGINNGVISYEKQGKWFHSLIILVPGSSNNLLVSLHPQTNPQDFKPGEVVEMAVQPRFYNGRFSGLVEA